MKYEILQSGSDGNCTIINGNVAIDMGVSFKKISPHAVGLQLVLLTHHHGDHFKPSTVRTLARMKPLLRWGCCEWMVPYLHACGVDYRNIDLFEAGAGFDYEYKDLGIRVRPERLYHNVQNCGYHICTTDLKDWLFYATDTGTLDGIEAKGYDTYLIEANHRESELEARADAKLAAGEFSYEAAAAENHLSYEQAIEWLMENAGPQSVWVPMHLHVEREGEHGRKTDAVEEDHQS